MMKRFWMVLSVISVLFLWGCSNTPDGPKPCTNSTECSTGERCVRQICKKFEISNEPPTASIKNQKEENRFRQNTVIKLDGSRSNDPDGDKLTYAWSFVEKPGTSKTKIDNADKVEASFKADVEGNYIVQLIVSDLKQSKSAPARIKFEIYGKDGNGDPIANAGTDQIVGVNQDVTLNGSNSSDPDGDDLNFAWTIKTKPTGSKATITDADKKQAKFKTDLPGRYIVELVVNDGLEDSTPDSVTIRALSDFDLKPKTTKINPAEGFIGTDLQVTITGSEFSKEASVIFDGVALDAKRVKFVSATELKVALPLGGKSAAKYEITVSNPNGVSSKPPLEFTAKALPKPKIDSLTPPLAVEGAKIEVVVKGTGFMDKTEVLFQAVPLKTTFVSATELKVQLDLSQTLAGTYKVQARNPGNISSDPVDFKVIVPGPPPVLKVLNPPFAKTGAKITFSIHGTGFSQGAWIEFDGKKIPSKRIRRDQINADGGLDLTNVQPGKYTVYAVNQDGRKSNKEEFVVEGTQPTPAISRILPFFVYMDGPNKIGVYGTGFEKGASLELGSNSIKGADVRWRSSTFMEVSVDTTKGTWKPGDVMAKVKNASGKISNGFNITIAYRVPTIASITPDGWVNKCDTTVTIRGTNFIKKSKVLFGKDIYTTTSTTHKLTFVSDKELTFKLIGSKAPVGSFSVYVDNGPSAKSTAATFAMMSASPTTPEINYVRPSAAAADTQANITMGAVSGKNFFKGAIAYLDGKPQATTCVTFGTSTQCSTLTVSLDLTGYKLGLHKLSVANACGKPGKETPFLVSEPHKPYIGTITPSYAYTGDKKSFTITGVNFSKRMKFFWGGKEVPITYKDDKSFSTKAPVDLTGAKTGEVDLQVDNGNNNKSAIVKFSVLPKAHPLRIDNVSTKEFEPEKTYNNLTVVGSGFTANTEFFFNGKKVTAKFSVSTLVTVSGISFVGLKAGTYPLIAKDAGKQSNVFPLFAKPFPPPYLERLSVDKAYKGYGNITLYLYGARFCTPRGTTCTTNPKVSLIDSKGKDWGSQYSITRSYISGTYAYVYGTLNTTSLPADSYKVYFVLPGGTKSNPALFTVHPVPTPELQRFSPLFGYAGQSFTLYLYALHFCPLSGTRCAQNPTISITSNGLTNYAANYKITRTYYSTSSNYGYMYGTFDTKNLKPGQYKFQITHPTNKKKSNILTFYVKPTPGPQPQRFDPAYIVAGSNVTLRLYVNNFCTRSGTRCTSNPSISITDPANPLVNYGSNYKITYAYSSSPTYGYVRGPFDATKMKPGKYKFVMTHPTNKLKSKPVNLIIRAAPAPVITYMYPYYVRSTATTTVSLYGNFFTNQSKAYMDGKALTTTYSSPTYLRVTIPGATFGAGAHYLTVKTGTKTSAQYGTWIVGSSSPVITRMSSPIYKDWKSSFYIYGYNWVRSKTPKFIMNGKAITLTPSYCYTTGTTYQYCYFSNYTMNLGPGKHTMVYDSGTSKSKPFNFYVGQPLDAEIRYISPQTVVRGVATQRITVYGNYFQSGSSLKIGTKTFALTYSSPTYMYATINTSTLTEGIHVVTVVGPSKKETNEVFITVE